MKHIPISKSRVVSHRDNYRSGLLIDNFHSTIDGTVTISADLTTYDNGLYGIDIENDTYLDVMLDKRGSITACNDDQVDILNNGNGAIERSVSL